MTFVLNQPVVTTTPDVAVDPILRSGNYRFRLVVQDNHGNGSQPAEVVVTVLPRGQAVGPAVGEIP